MNFLAHLLLTDPTPAARIGSLLPDLVRGPLPDGLDPEVRQAVEQHRHVDRVTDTHPATLRAVERLREPHGRFAPIVVDVWFDHVLASAWSHYSDAAWGEFVHGVYDDLINHPYLTPPAMWQLSRRMARQDWLGCYATRDGVELTLRRMSRRLRERLGRPVRLDAAMADLDRVSAAIADDFHTLWLDLLTLASPGSVALPLDPVVRYSA